MSNPTGNALMARIKELEEALGKIERYLDSNPNNLNVIEARQIIIKALHK